MVLSHEGGYRNRPSDPGGATKYGISARSYPQLDIPRLTRDEAISIYKRDWWDAYGYARIGNRLLRVKVFDLAVNIGPGRAHRFLQWAVNDVVQSGAGPASLLLAVYGNLGPLTLQSIGFLDPCALLLRFLARVHAHYKRCAITQPDELKGWENRLWSLA